MLLNTATRVNQQLSMDFICDRLSNRRTFRVLTIIDQYSRECPILEALERLAWSRGGPATITVDNGSEFCYRAVDDWAYRNGVKLDIIQPGRPVENEFNESFNGRLRDGCLNTESCFTVADAREKPEQCRRDYNECRPHSAVSGMSPLEYLQQAGKP